MCLYLLTGPGITSHMILHQLVFDFELAIILCIKLNTVLIDIFLL
jgi:hypothetical protein